MFLIKELFHFLVFRENTLSEHAGQRENDRIMQMEQRYRGENSQFIDIQ
jgi:hypothetical protein